jgi:hypothetical protein
VQLKAILSRQQQSEDANRAIVADLQRALDARVSELAALRQQTDTELGALRQQAAAAAAAADKARKKKERADQEVRAWVCVRRHGCQPSTCRFGLCLRSTKRNEKNRRRKAAKRRRCFCSWRRRPHEN